MMPAANQGLGMNLGFPDVCTTPMAPAPVPIPYPNIGMNAMAMPFVPNVLVSMAPAHNMGAKPTLTNGDNAGVAHPLFMQPGGTLMGNPKVLMGGMPANHLLTPSYGNNFNNPVGAKTVPSITNVLLASCATLAQLRSERGELRRLRGGTAVLTLPCISLRSDRVLTTQLQTLEGGHLNALVLDLRGNPGGDVAAAHRIAAALGALALPIALLIDRDTASAAELLAAILQDRFGAKTFGERSRGKGTAAWFRIIDDQLTASRAAMRFVREDGSELHGAGIAADEPCAPCASLAAATHWLRSARRAS